MPAKCSHCTSCCTSTDLHSWRSTEPLLAASLSARKRRFIMFNEALYNGSGDLFYSFFKAQKKGVLWSGGRTDKISNKLAGDVACLGALMVEHQPRLLGSRARFPAGAFAIFSVSAKASLPISLSPFLSSFFPFLFLSLPLPLPSTFRLRFKISLFAFIPLITILSGRAWCTMATVTGSPSEAGLVCGHWMVPVLWSGGRMDKVSNKLAGDVACLGGLMVEHQPRLLGSRVRFPAGVFAIFSVSVKASLPISLSPFLSSFFPFLFLSLPLPLPSTFRLALKFHSSHLSLSTVLPSSQL